MKDLYIGKSSIAGRGIYANEDIEAGEFVTGMNGKIVYKVFKTKSDLNTGKTWVGIGGNYWVVPAFPVKYMNHSCNANLGYKTPRRLYARRKIKKGEELSIDYSTVEDVIEWNMPCSCHAKECRKIMRSIQFLPRKIFLSYLPYIPKFYQDVYVKFNGKG